MLKQIPFSSKRLHYHDIHFQSTFLSTKVDQTQYCYGFVGAVYQHMVWKKWPPLTKWEQSRIFKTLGFCFVLFCFCSVLFLGVLLEYPTTTCFQWGHLMNGTYTYTVSGGNGVKRSSFRIPLRLSLFLFYFVLFSCFSFVFF